VAAAWQVSGLSIAGALAAFYVVYDFNYTLLHRFLHVRSVYAYVHKHHHHQVVPTRGVIDAINVHPIEFLLGEWNHVVAVWFVSRFLFPCHVITVLLFLITGGFTAALNHTRHDVVVRVPFLGWLLYDVRSHDIHHRIPQSNYGQYTMLWDRIMGSYKPYEE
jgi:sterol desaturase/sphingolipid hydroxylase (fatty acid hydroxylase superfamily)